MNRGIGYRKSMENNPPTLRQLFPELDEGQLVEAEQNLDRYLAVVLGIFERLHNAQAGKLTGGTGTLGCTPPKHGPSVNT
jgi:hypothetical protein